MDDFIDDSDAKVDISAEIRNIFGYDRRKFRDEVRKMILLYWMRQIQTRRTYFVSSTPICFYL